MKVGIWHNLPSGGGRRALFDQVNGLLRRGHQVKVWCPPQADRSFLPFDDFCPEKVVPWDRRERLAGPLGWVRAQGANRRQLEEHCRKVAHEMAQEGCDIALVHPCQFHRASPLGRFLAIPSALYQQEPFRWFYEAMPRQRWEAAEDTFGFWTSPRRSLRWLQAQLRLHPDRHQVRWEREDASRFDRILVNSLFSRESLLGAYGIDSQVCRLGVNSELFQPASAPVTRRCVVGLGAIVPEKGIETVLVALSKIPLARRPCLEWVGNVADSAHLEAMHAKAKTLGVDFRPHLRAPQEVVLKLLQESICLAYAPRLEPFGYAPIEAGACGTAVVGLAEAGVRETVRHGENGLLAESPEEFAQALDRLVCDLDLAERLGQEGRRQATGVWGLDEAIGRLEKSLLSIIEEHQESGA